MAFNGNNLIPQVAKALNDSNPFVPGGIGLGDLQGFFKRPDMSIMAPFSKPSPILAEALRNLQTPNETIKYDILNPTTIPVVNAFDLAGAGGSLTTTVATVSIGALKNVKSAFTFKEIESSLRASGTAPESMGKLIFSAFFYNAAMNLCEDLAIDARNYLLTQKATPLPLTNDTMETIASGFDTVGLDRTYTRVALNYFLQAIYNEYQGQKLDAYGETPYLLHTSTVLNHGMYDMDVANGHTERLSQLKNFIPVTISNGLGKIVATDSGLALCIAPNALGFTTYTMPQITRNNDLIGELSDTFGFNVGSPDTVIIPNVTVPRMGVNNIYQPDIEVTIVLRNSNFDGRGVAPIFEERAFDVRTEMYVAYRPVFFRKSIDLPLLSYRQLM